MILNQVTFTFQGAIISWILDDRRAPSYQVTMTYLDKERISRDKSFLTSKAPTVNNARKFIEQHQAK